MLTPAQLAAYEADGFVAVPGFADEATRTALARRAAEIVATTGPGPDGTVFSTRDQRHGAEADFLTSGDRIRCFLEEEPGADGRPRVNKIGHALHDLDPVFEAFSYSARVAEVLADLGYADPRLLQSMWILKDAHVGGEVTPHTDHTFLWTEPQSVTALWFAIDDATVHNGCLWVLPGAHRSPARSRFRREGAGTTTDVYDPAPYPDEEFVPIEADAGTLVVLHGQLPHRSSANRSDRPRAAYTLHAIDGTATYLADNWLQRRADMPLREVFR